MTRQTRTPKERAELELGVADRKVKKLQARVKTLRAELIDAETELAEAMKLRDFLKQHPALQQTTTPTQEGSTR